jgi:hypothetical protein
MIYIKNWIRFKSAFVLLSPKLQILIDIGFRPIICQKIDFGLYEIGRIMILRRFVKDIFSSVYRIIAIL